MKLSYIIPALDEEKNIRGTLGQFSGIDGDYEVIVADGGSRDMTRQIARRMGAKVYKNERDDQNAAKNRNLGAEHATGEILVFCDADTRIKDIQAFHDRVSKVFRDYEIVAGMPVINIAPKQKIWKDTAFHSVVNSLMEASFALRYPYSSGQCQIVRKSAFKKVGGYNPWQVHGEDTYLFRKLALVGKLHFFSDLVAYESPRRYRKYGYLKVAAKGIGSMAGQAILKKNVLKEWERVD